MILNLLIISKMRGGGNKKADINKILEYKGFTNIILIEGDVRVTYTELLKSKPSLMFNCVHLDMDVYEPTAFIINQIYDRIVGGGIIMIDDYPTVYGATQAINEFLEKHPELEINKPLYSHIPSYIIKK